MTSNVNTPDTTALRQAAVEARRNWLRQHRWNDATARKARSTAWGAVKTYAAASGLSFAEAMAEVTRLAGQA